MTSRRPLAFRLLADAFTALFVLCMSGLPLAHRPCPHHDTLAGLAHELGGGAPAHQHHGHPGGDHTGPCTCPGPCHTAAAVLLPAATRVVVAWIVVHGAAADWAPVAARRPPLPEHTLPFSHAPPAIG